eukprot:gene48781-biopygen34117
MIMPLTTSTNIDKPDDFYADLIGAHEGLSKAESDAFNARLILLLANQNGAYGSWTRVMKVRSSLKSLKNRHRDCKLVRRKGVMYVINKTDPRFKAKQG